MPQKFGFSNYVHDFLHVTGPDNGDDVYIIADEFKSMDNKDMRPEDYLNFFCLGNREEPPSNGSPESEKSTDKRPEGVCFCIFPYS